jgi:hypothetical protein
MKSCARRLLGLMRRFAPLALFIFLGGLLVAIARAEPAINDPVVHSSEFRDVLQKFDNERDRRYSESFTSLQKAMDAGFTAQAIAVQAAFAAQEKAIAAAFAAQEKATAAALAAAKEAVAKAEVASDKRFESVNEFRGQLKDQASTFVLHSEYLSDHAAVVSRLDAVDSTEAKIIGGLIFAATLLPIVSGITVFIITRKDRRRDGNV